MATEHQTMTSTERKRPRDEFESTDDVIPDNVNHEMQSPTTKKQRLQNNQHKKIDINDCRVIFSATQPVKNVDGMFKWKATLKHRYYEQNKQATLAKASFCFLYKDELLKHQELSCLHDVIDMVVNDYDLEFSGWILYLESIEVMDVFRGFDYEYCLVQRIVDLHARYEDMIVIKHNDSVEQFCENMEFYPLEETEFYSRFQWCMRVQTKAEKQRITDTILSNHYTLSECTDDDEKVRSENNNEEVNINMDEVFVQFECSSNATNYQIEEDFTSLWSAKLKFQSNTLATAQFWFIELTRLSNMGWYDSICTVLDAPCQEVADLLAVVNTDWGERFKLDDSDRINHFRVRLEKKLLELQSDDKYDIEWITSQLLPEYGDEMNEGGGANIVYLDRVEVKKEYRGHGYGRCLTQKIIDNFARGFDGVVLKPFPLQWETKPSDSNTELTEEEKKSFEKDKKKVIDVWESMWFYPFGGPNSQYWGRSEAWTHPKMEAFCKCFQSTTSQ